MDLIIEENGCFWNGWLRAWQRHDLGLAAGIAAAVPPIFSFGNFISWGDIWLSFRSCF